MLKRMFVSCAIGRFQSRQTRCKSTAVRAREAPHAPHGLKVSVEREKDGHGERGEDDRDHKPLLREDELTNVHLAAELVVLDDLAVALGLVVGVRHDQHEQPRPHADGGARAAAQPGAHEHVRPFACAHVRRQIQRLVVRGLPRLLSDGARTDIGASK